MMTTEGISIDVVARAARSCISTLRECHADMQLRRVGLIPHSRNKTAAPSGRHAVKCSGPAMGKAQFQIQGERNDEDSQNSAAA